MNNVLHIYTRVSGKQQVDNFSLESQKNEGIRYAERLKMQYHVHVEPGLSAKYDDIENRPVLKALITDCINGNIKHIFVTEPDRLVRSDIAQIGLNRVFSAHDVTLHTLSHKFNLKDTDHQFISSLFALVGQRENANKTKKVIRGLLDASIDGKWTGGILLPYGYKRDDNGYLIVDEEEKKVYLEAVEMCLDGIGTNTIAKRLNEAGYPTRGRKHLVNGFHKFNRQTRVHTHVPNGEIIWRDATVYQILLNPIYKGERRYKDRILKAPQLIDPEQWNKLQASLHSRHKTRTVTHFYMLKGLLRCGVCGDNLHGRKRFKPGNSTEGFYSCVSRRYAGESCGNKSLNLAGMDNAIWLTVISNTSMFLDQVNKGSLPTTEVDYKKRISIVSNKIKDEKKRKGNLIILFENSRIDLNTFDDRNAIIDRAIENFEKQLVELRKFKSNSQKNDQLEGLKNSLKKFSLVCPEQEKRDLLLSIVKNIIITYIPKKSIHTVVVEFIFMKSISFNIKYDQSKKKFDFSLPQVM